MDSTNKVEAIRGHIAELAKLAGFSVTDVLSSDLSGLEELVAIPEAQPTQGSPAVLLEVGMFMLGWDEDDDRDKLVEQFEKAGVVDGNGKILDPSVWGWCAGFFDLLLFLAGMSIVGSLAAKVFWNPDKKIEAPYPGCGASWRNHIAVFVGYADEELLATLPEPFKVMSAEEWESVKCDADHPNAVAMVFGGNQSDMVNISPVYFYNQYSKFNGYFEVV